MCLQSQCQAVQDVERAVSLFESTGRISATVMEARYMPAGTKADPEAPDVSDLPLNESGY